MRAVAIVVTLFALVLSARGISAAQNVTPGDIEIVVADALTHQPVDNAEVFLLGGDASRSSLTDAHGRLVFSGVQPGSYAIRVQRENYVRTDVASFDVDEGQHLHVRVALAPVLKVITSVTAHSTVDISAESVGEQSPERQVSDSLRGALGKIAGVDAGDDSYGPGSVFNVSLRNHDASQTGYSIDGIRIAGQSQGLLGAGQDLFTGANVSFAPVAGYAGGSINFSTLRPTKDWKFGFVNTLGSYGAASTSVSATGALAKRLRIAVQHVRTSRDAFLSGYTYEDQSANSYLHEGANSSTGDLFKASYDISKVTSLAASAYLTNATFSPICSSFVTNQPCGQGPGAQSFSRNMFASLEFNTLAGNTQIGAYAGIPSGGYTYANIKRTTNGLSSPYYSTNRYFGGSFGLSASATSRRHTFSVNLAEESYGNSTSMTYDGIPNSYGEPRSRYFLLSLGSTVKASDKLAFAHTLSYSSGTGSGAADAFQAGERITWERANDTLEGSFSAGSTYPSFPVAGAISDPLSADFNCNSGTTFVSGPGDPSTRQSSVNYQFAWHHSGKRGTFDVSLYRQNMYGAQFYGSVPIAAEPASLFPSGLDQYLNALQNVWSQSTVCGSTPFDPQRVYVSQYISGVSQVFAGANISARQRLGTNVLAVANYSVGSTYLNGLTPLLDAPGSFYQQQAQLPRRPLHTANLILDFAMPRAPVQWLFNAHFTGLNNQNNLPAFTTYSAGLLYTTKRGTITFTESNLFGSHTGLFTTYQDVNAMPLTGGGSFAYSTTPLPPRQWTFTYRLSLPEKPKAKTTH